jgi:two-component system copper resistance phosphate regulon response regulator CusR
LGERFDETKSTMKILVIEDEAQVSAFIKQGLEEQSFEVEVAYDGKMAERLALSRPYDVLLMDIVLPGMNGLDLCRIIKTEKPAIPVLMLTTLSTTIDKVSGFTAGADDYLVKPFVFDELIARLKALYRRSSLRPGTGNNAIMFNGLKLDLEKKIATRENKNIKLSAKEFALLEYFLNNPERVIPRSELAAKVWNITFDTGTNVVDVYMNMLRNKVDRDFEPKLLQTRIGLGYILTKEV